MKPKSKPSKSGWGVCKQCQCYMSPSDVSKHMDSCHGKGTEDKYGFVRNDILHGFARKRQERGEEVGKLPKSLAVQVALLHPSFMTLCQVGIGTSVLVWASRDKFALLTAWPSKEGTLTDIGLSAQVQHLFKCKTGDVLHVQRLEDQVHKPAEELVLEAREQKPFFNSDDFASYFIDAVEGKLVTAGQSLFINYYGQPCELKVTEISPDDHCAEENVSTTSRASVSPLSVADSFSELSIGESISPGSPVVMTSTPKRRIQGALCSCESHKPVRKGSWHHIDTMTKVRFAGHESETQESNLPETKKVSFEDIGGLAKQIEEIKRFLFPPKEETQRLSSWGLSQPRGTVLHGPPGTGKTMIGQAVATIMQHNFLLMNGAELCSKVFGETEDKLRKVFNEARKRAPSVIFIDEIDSLCPKREGSSTEQEQRVMATLRTLMDALPTNPDNRVIVLAATNNLSALDPAMRRVGRFDSEIEIGIPTSSERLQILKCMLRNFSHDLSEEEIAAMASSTHGQVGADLEAICNQAWLNAIRSSESCGKPPEGSARVRDFAITYSDMVQAAKKIKPSGMRGFLLDIPKVSWDDVGGMEELKHKLKQAVEWPLKHPEVFQRLGITPPKGILMYGPPGCSKTLIAKALATESGLNFIAIKGSEVFSKWVGESEKAIRGVFSKAREVAPSIVFFDEIEAVAPERGSSSGGSNVGDRVLAQLLSEMDGLENLKGVTIVAATNRPDMIDKALLRPGRLDRIIYVGIPDANTRTEIFRIQFRRIPIAADVEISRLVERTEGYTGAEIVAVCKEAGFNAADECMAAVQVSERHFLYALRAVQPRTTKETLEFYEKYRDHR